MGLIRLIFNRISPIKPMVLFLPVPLSAIRADMPVDEVAKPLPHNRVAAQAADPVIDGFLPASG